jgi:hypothetical protein
LIVKKTRPHSQGIQGSTTIVASTQHTKCGKVLTGQSALKIKSQSVSQSHGTTSGRPIPQSSSAKKVVRHCEFSEKFGILEKHHVSNDATENAWFLSDLICLPGNGP